MNELEDSGNKSRTKLIGNKNNKRTSYFLFLMHEHIFYINNKTHH